ncbi:MAG: hypothetical protein HRT66_04740 [Flavobacteriaceae bacterium]|nr:hypothetical protein [Flavobacteriaceae bacterium]
MSAGVGYFYKKNQRVRVQFSLGIVPKSREGSSSIIVTLAHEFQVIKPIIINKNFKWSLINPGAQFSYISGIEYNGLNDDYYNDYYYLFSANVIYRFYFRSELLWINTHKFLGSKKIGFYFETGRNLTSILTGFKNQEVNYLDTASLGLGFNFYLY